MSMNSMLLAIRLRNVTDASMIHLRTHERERLLKIKNTIFNIIIPSEELGLYHRLIRDDGPHIGQALKWKSIVAFKLPNKSWEEDEVIIDKI
jgi:ribosomal protein L10